MWWWITWSRGGEKTSTRTLRCWKPTPGPGPFSGIPGARAPVCVPPGCTGKHYEVDTRAPGGCGCQHHRVSERAGGVPEERGGEDIVLFERGAMYGEPVTLPCDEDHPVRPLSPYGAAKAALELYLPIYRSLYGSKYSALRYANVYGPRQNPRRRGRRGGDIRGPDAGWGSGLYQRVGGTGEGLCVRGGHRTGERFGTNRRGR